MSNQTTQFKRFISALVAVTGVVVANLIAAEPADVTSDRSLIDDRADVAAVPAPITGIAPPRGIIESTDHGIVVPAIHGTRSSELPPIDLGTIRERARVWLGDGVVAAPTSTIEVAAPEIDGTATMEEISIDVPELVRSELPVPPAVR